MKTPLRWRKMRRYGGDNKTEEQEVVKQWQESKEGGERV